MLMHKHSMPPTGPRVMDSPIRPSPPGLERRWKVAARGTDSSSCSGCQVSCVWSGLFPSVIILLVSRWPDDFPSSSFFLFLPFWTGSLCFLLLFFSLFSLTPSPSLRLSSS
ncbi:hypothetical protein BDV23DRAFT_92975 [Aspergillus alliaceus]|uniref:Uncharacterized protein n=1 Tax=Petromyces alliaceus TaxID=209559 RepID=A0A5N7C7D6_PETAA|nr:hypothetical protein BDV23DRAFT_92975 [Aspergillus alliaceus]